MVRRINTADRIKIASIQKEIYSLEEHSSSSCAQSSRDKAKRSLKIIKLLQQKREILAKYK